MPTPSPRINVVVSVEQHQLLTELGQLQGRSLGSYLREMLDNTTPLLVAMLPVYRAAAQQAQMQPQLLQKAIRDAQAGLDEKTAQLDLLKLISEVSSGVANDAVGAAAAASSVAREDGGKPASGKGRKRA